MDFGLWRMLHVLANQPSQNGIVEVVFQYGSRSRRNSGPSHWPNAQELYFRKAHDDNPKHLYTPLIISNAGKQDGLYWSAAESQHEDEQASPLGRLSDFARICSSPLLFFNLYRLTIGWRKQALTLKTPCTGSMSVIFNRDFRYCVAGVRSQKAS
jgi:hypothetical protein